LIKIILKNNVEGGGGGLWHIEEDFPLSWGFLTPDPSFLTLVPPC